MDALLGNGSDGASGHELLIQRAGRENLGYVSKYIREKLTNDEARIVDGYLARYPERVQEFVDAIPPENTATAVKTGVQIGGLVAGHCGGFQCGTLGRSSGCEDNLCGMVARLFGAPTTASR